MVSNSLTSCINRFAFALELRVLFLEDIKMSAEQSQGDQHRHVEWFRNLFTEDSNTDDIILFIKNVFELEKRLKIDIINFLENSHLNLKKLPLKIDVKDGLYVVDFISTRLDSDSNGAEVIAHFVRENKHLMEKYNLDCGHLEALVKRHLSDLSFSQVMNVVSVFEQKRNRQMIHENDLRNVIKCAPKLIRSETVAAADLLNELASLCITTSSKSEIKVVINDIDDVRISIDAASMINNIRNAIMNHYADELSNLKGKSFNVEISNKLVKSIFNQ